MGVKLELMSTEDYKHFLEISIVDYAASHVKAGNWKEEESIEKSTNEFNQLLPHGIETPNQYLYTIVDVEKDSILGYLWVNISEKSKEKAFIYQILIFEEFRGKGYGKQSLNALEEEMKKHNVTEIGLHVFGHNPTAIELYKKVGYDVTSLRMAKKI